jgi:hypothetical protein
LDNHLYSLTIGNINEFEKFIYFDGGLVQLEYMGKLFRENKDKENQFTNILIFN